MHVKGLGDKDWQMRIILQWVFARRSPHPPMLGLCNSLSVAGQRKYIYLYFCNAKGNVHPKIWAVEIKFKLLV